MNRNPLDEAPLIKNLPSLNIYSQETKGEILYGTTLIQDLSCT
nr:hypothetical protein [[Clostridium] polysaccharolyticum]